MKHNYTMTLVNVKKHNGLVASLLLPDITYKD